MWIWKGHGMEPLPGVPARDLTDEEFEEYAKEYDSHYHEGALAGCPLFEHRADKKEKVKNDADE